MISIYITVDAEWDRTSNKKHISTRNLAKIPRFQTLCSQNKIKPIYFCSYEALENEEFVSYLKPFLKKKEIEIGAHLHPWSNPPFTSLKESDLTPFPTQLSLELFEKKMQKLTEKIKLIFEYEPVSYRAGRFGLSYKHIPILKKMGYFIDSSISPLINWKNLNASAPDYRDFKNADRTIISYQNVEMLEFPVTIIENKSYTLKNLAKRILENKPIWFRIYPTTHFTDLKYIVNNAIKKNIKQLTFFIHSNELDWENNSYFKTEKEVDKLYLLLSKLFSYLNKKKINSDIFANQIGE